MKRLKQNKTNKKKWTDKINKNIAIPLFMVFHSFTYGHEKKKIKRSSPRLEQNYFKCFGYWSF